VIVLTVFPANFLTKQTKNTRSNFKKVMVSNVYRPVDPIAISKDLTQVTFILHRLDIVSTTLPPEKQMKHTTKNFPVPLSATASRRFAIVLGPLSRHDQCLSTNGHDATK
jgi:hypothetical protein